MESQGRDTSEVTRQAKSEATLLKGLLIGVESEVNKLKDSLTDAEGEATRLKEEIIRLQGSLAEAKEKASFVEHRALEVVTGAI